MRLDVPTVVSCELTTLKSDIAIHCVFNRFINASTKYHAAASWRKT